MPSHQPTAAGDADSTFIKVQRSGLNAAGGRDLQAIGLTKGGWNTRLYAGRGRARDARGPVVDGRLDG